MRIAFQISGSPHKTQKSKQNRLSYVDGWNHCKSEGMATSMTLLCKKIIIHQFNAFKHVHVLEPDIYTSEINLGENQTNLRAFL